MPAVTRPIRGSSDFDTASEDDLKMIVDAMKQAGNCVHFSIPVKQTGQGREIHQDITTSVFARVP